VIGFNIIEDVAFSTKLDLHGCPVISVACQRPCHRGQHKEQNNYEQYLFYHVSSFPYRFQLRAILPKDLCSKFSLILSSILALTEIFLVADQLPPSQYRLA